MSVSNSGGSVQKILYVTVTGCEYGQYLYTPSYATMGGLVVVTKDNETFFEQVVNNTDTVRSYVSLRTHIMSL